MKFLDLKASNSFRHSQKKEKKEEKIAERNYFRVGFLRFASTLSRSAYLLLHLNSKKKETFCWLFVGPFARPNTTRARQEPHYYIGWAEAAKRISISSLFLYTFSLSNALAVRIFCFIVVAQSQSLYYTIKWNISALRKLKKKIPKIEGDSRKSGCHTEYGSAGSALACVCV